MSIVAVTSSRTSPGATTVATGLALVWSRRFEQSLLVEADPSGGVLGLRFGLAPSPSLATFGSDVRNGWTPEALWSNTQELRGTACLSAPVDGRLASPWIERSAPALIEHLPGLGVPVAHVAEADAVEPLVDGPAGSLAGGRADLRPVLAVPALPRHR